MNLRSCKGCKNIRSAVCSLVIGLWRHWIQIRRIGIAHWRGVPAPGEERSQKTFAFWDPSENHRNRCFQSTRTRWIINERTMHLRVCQRMIQSCKLIHKISDNRHSNLHIWIISGTESAHLSCAQNYSALSMHSVNWCQFTTENLWRSLFWILIGVQNKLKFDDNFWERKASSWTNVPTCHPTLP